MKRGTRETTCVGYGPRERMSLAVVPVLAVVVLALAATAAGNVGPDIFFSPSRAMLEPGETVEVSFRVWASEDSISGYQLYLSFDPGVVELVSATQGSLYAYSGCPTWFIPEEEGAGYWHFFDTVMGTGTYVLPPGELLHLEFEALTYGTTELHIDSILLADVERENLPVASYEHGCIFVIEATGVDEIGGTVGLGPAYPNPFRSNTAIPFSAPADGLAESIEIYDVAGRLVRRLCLPGGTTEGEMVWDGRDACGEEVPSSVYFVRLDGRTSSAHCRLVKTD